MSLRALAFSKPALFRLARAHDGSVHARACLAGMAWRMQRLANLRWKRGLALAAIDAPVRVWWRFPARLKPAGALCVCSPFDPQLTINNPSS